MVRFFKEFLVTCFDLTSDDFSMKLNVYLGNGLSIEEIEDHWLEILELPRTCLRKHVVDHFPTSSSGTRVNRLPYGVCSLSVRRSTALREAREGTSRPRDASVRAARGGRWNLGRGEDRTAAPDRQTTWTGGADQSKAARCGRTVGRDLVVAEQQLEQCLLGVEAVLRLVPDR